MIFVIVLLTIVTVMINSLVIVDLLTINNQLITLNTTHLISDISDQGTLRATCISLHLILTKFREPSVFFIVLSLCTVVARGPAHP